MIGIAIKLALRGLFKRLSGLWGIARRYPLAAALILAVLTAGWLWHGKSVEHRRYLAELGARAADRAEYEQASLANAAAQVAQNKAWEAKSTLAAKEADDEYAQGLADGRTAADRYIASHRVPAQVIRISAPGSSSQGTGASVPFEVPAGTVMVSEGDVQICTAATGYAITAHNHAMAKVEAGLAEVVQ